MNQVEAILGTPAVMFPQRDCQTSTSVLSFITSVLLLQQLEMHTQVENWLHTNM